MSALLRSLSTQAPVVASPLDGSDAGSSGSGSMQAQLDSVQARLMALEARGGGLAASSPADVAPAASGSVCSEDCVALTCALIVFSVLFPSGALWCFWCPFRDGCLPRDGYPSSRCFAARSQQDRLNF